MNNSEILSAILGQLMPLIAEAINSKISDDKIRYFTAMGLSVIIGFLSMIAVGEYSGENILGSVGVAFISSQTAYRTWFKNSDVEKRINETFSK